MILKYFSTVTCSFNLYSALTLKTLTHIPGISNNISSVRESCYLLLNRSYLGEKLSLVISAKLIMLKIKTNRTTKESHSQGLVVESCFVEGIAPLSYSPIRLPVFTWSWLVTPAIEFQDPEPSWVICWLLI